MVRGSKLQVPCYCFFSIHDCSPPQGHNHIPLANVCPLTNLKHTFHDSRLTNNCSWFLEERKSSGFQVPCSRRETEVLPSSFSLIAFSLKAFFRLLTSDFCLLTSDFRLLSSDLFPNTQTRNNSSYSLLTAHYFVRWQSVKCVNKK